MGIIPESSHHEGGPGQNEIDFRHADPLSASDNAMTFKAVVRTIAAQNGLHADFSPRPLADAPGSGMHVNISAEDGSGSDLFPAVIAGLLDKVGEMTLFLNPCENSYERLGRDRAPRTIGWSPENRSQLIRIPAASGPYRRIELRSPDPTANPYLAFALAVRAGLRGIESGLTPPQAEGADAPGLSLLPSSLAEARRLASESAFLRSCLPETVIASYMGL